MTRDEAIAALVAALPRCRGRWLVSSPFDDDMVWAGDAGCRELATHYRSDGEDGWDYYCARHAAEIGVFDPDAEDDGDRCVPLERVRVPIAAVMALAATVKS